MKLAKIRLATGEIKVAWWKDEQFQLLVTNSRFHALSDILEAEDPLETAMSLVDTDSEPLPLENVEILAPIDRQEVWAAGVTYTRSKTARMEESEAAASCYDRVYTSPRPELFMKATPHRVSGPGQPLRIRTDSEWNVPEPELALVINSRKELVGYTIGNDMSSRDIEGDNPLYLPQAKVYDQCCGLGPCVTLTAGMPRRNEIGIHLTILRRGQTVFTGSTDIGQMARSFEDLIQWLGRDNSFPAGAFLLTGTGVVPDSDFTLEVDDEVQIEIDGVGMLSNPVIQG
ncbi:fumarylacetoacetate hydrolase family protein [Lignipirellula cremea]|uniref:Fumarylacetoacetate (FAA) hydrolase family protein n=1 Tax=Lignipirellula cremea TaxID=2528010 RepID=A0A518E2J1_9BACT|nr:fumarylacetoacetate hydrolase family protein [Lignipirellula cremea]QDU98282.1 Fumarylacetoacetate (FAA) hydrolase family protein [Lignipirellula cremea]